jgi:geranylgeranyl reductase family protein
MEGVLKSGEKDVIIIGAGPAGISTALFLARQGIRSTLAEKASFPRDKICGDGLSGWTMKMLRRLDPDLPAKVASHPAQLASGGIRVYAPGLHSVALPYQNKDYPLEPPGHVMRRIDFDTILMDEAVKNPLIEVITGVTVQSIETGDDGVRVMANDGATLRAKITVVAAGAGGRIKLPFATDAVMSGDMATGIRQYYSGITGFHEGNFVDFYFLRDFLPGYLWVFPLPNGMANVGAGIRTDILRKRKVSLKSVMEQAIRENPQLAGRFSNAKAESGVAAWSLPLGSSKRVLSGNRILLAGDAAALVDPFTGEGIGNAMWSGQAAAGHIAAALEKGRFDSEYNKHYDRLIYKKLWPEMRLSARIQWLVSHPALFNWVAAKVERHPDLQQKLTRMISEPNQLKKLTMPSFYAALLGRK